MRKAARKAAASLEGAKPEVPRAKRDESSYHKGSCDMRRIPDPDREGADPGEWDRIQPGDFWWGTEEAQIGATTVIYRTLWAKYPDGSNACLPIDMPEEVKRAGLRHASWGWDGNEDKPTLTPSVHHIGHWHGWVRAGRMMSV